jgi:hypothetical protein
MLVEKFFKYIFYRKNLNYLEMDAYNFLLVFFLFMMPGLKVLFFLLLEFQV